MKEMKMPQKKVYIWELSRFWKFVVATDMTDMKSEEKSGLILIPEVSEQR